MFCPAPTSAACASQRRKDCAMPGPIVRPSPYIEPDVPPVPEPRGPLTGPGPDILPEPEPGVPPREPSTPKPGDPVPHNQTGLADPRTLTPGPAGDYEPGGELSKHPATQIRIDQSQPNPISPPPSQPAPPPRPESVPPQPGQPMEEPMAPKPGPPQAPAPEPPAPPTWGAKGAGLIQSLTGRSWKRQSSSTVKSVRSR